MTYGVIVTVADSVTTYDQIHEAAGLGVGLVRGAQVLPNPHRVTCFTSDHYGCVGPGQVRSVGR